MRKHGRDLSGVFRLPRAVEAWVMIVHAIFVPCSLRINALRMAQKNLSIGRIFDMTLSYKQKKQRNYEKSIINYTSIGCANWVQHGTDEVWARWPKRLSIR